MNEKPSPYKNIRVGWTYPLTAAQRKQRKEALARVDEIIASPLRAKT
jgi:hypothetical protein